MCAALANRQGRIVCECRLSKENLSISVQAARRLAVTRQHLAGKLPAKATSEHILTKNIICQPPTDLLQDKLPSVNLTLPFFAKPPSVANVYVNSMLRL